MLVFRPWTNSKKTSPVLTADWTARQDGVFAASVISLHVFRVTKERRSSLRDVYAMTVRRLFVCHTHEPVSYTHLTLPTIYSV